MADKSIQPQTPNDSPTPAPSSLWCPFCKTPLRDDVPMTGQLVVCPGCNAQVKMPDATGRTQNAAMGQVVLSLVGVVIGLLVLAKGCAFMNLANSL